MITLNFDKLRVALGVSFKASQVVNIEAMLEAFNNYDYKSFGVSDKSWLSYVAYMFATAWHETGATMAPIEEYGKGRNKTYGTWYLNSKGVAYSFKNGKKKEAYTYTETPNLFYGRGYVQLTWYDNYAKASKKLGRDFIKDPTLALNKELATKIMIVGMLEGWFTGDKLSHYITDTKTDFKNARQIINGMDKASMIANYAEAFRASLKN